MNTSSQTSACVLSSKDITVVEMCSQGFFKYMSKGNKCFFIYIKHSNLSVLLTFTEETINRNNNNTINSVLYNCYKTIFILDESFPFHSHNKKYSSLNEVYQDLIVVFKNKAFDIKLMNQTQVVIVLSPHLGTEKVEITLTKVHEMFSQNISLQDKLLNLKMEINNYNLQNKIDKHETNHKELENKLLQLESHAKTLLQDIKQREFEISQQQKLEQEKLKQQQLEQQRLLQQQQQLEQQRLQQQQLEQEKLKQQQQQLQQQQRPKEIQQIITNGKVWKNPNEYDLICKWISTSYPVRLELVYSGKKLGFCSEDFHIYFDNIVPTIALIRTKKGNRFGGYTSQIWKGENEFKYDPTAFVFNLDTQTKYKIQPGQEKFATFCKGIYTVAFGNGDLVIGDQTKGYESLCKFPISYGSPNDAKYALTGGNQKFVLEEVEVYQVHYL